MAFTEREVTRRTALLQLLGLGVAAATSTVACGSSDATSNPLALPRQHADGDAPDAPKYSDALDALTDVLLPTERDAKGKVTVPGAREAEVDRVLDAGRFAPLAVGLGFVPPLPAAFMTAIAASGEAFRAALNAELDALAALERPLTGFADLPTDLREKIVARTLDGDDATSERLKPSFLLVRAACFAAYLGGIADDAGMIAIGMPKYEDHEDGLAISGYPRRKSTNKLIDPTETDLAALDAQGDLDDYTYNTEPPATAGDDLALILDENGDLR